MTVDISERVCINAAKDKVLYVDEITISSQEDLSFTSTVGYVLDLEWSAEEEDSVRRKIDIRLMSFVLLMTFVLNMDRTNICESRIRP
jgi:hypothetical protein